MHRSTVKALPSAISGHELLLGRTDMNTIDNVSHRPRTVLHLGMPKTATTLLQQCMFKWHSEVKNASKSNRPKLGKALRYLQNRESVPATIIEDVHDEMKPHWQAGKTCVLSKESLTGGDVAQKRRQAELFRRAFGECQILITIREPLSFIESLYFQDLKVFNVNPRSVNPRKRNRMVRQFGRPPRYFDINDWFSVVTVEPVARVNPRKRALAHLEMATTAEIYAEMFGEENVHLVIFEKLKHSLREFLADICGCLDVSLEEAISLCEGETRNIQWTQSSVDRLKSLEKSFFGKWTFRFKGGGQKELNRRIRHSDKAAHTTAPKARVHIDAKWRTMVERIGREQSQRLVERWRLPLAEYGYPVDENYKCSELAAA